jgi:hypothetical protein
MERSKVEQAVRKARTLLEQVSEQLDAIEAMLNDGDTPGQQARQALAFYGKAWESKYRTRHILPHVAGAMVQVKKLLKEMTLAELQAAMGQYLQSRDRFYVEARHPLAMFVKAVNKFTAAAPTDDLFEHAPPDCRHQPRCKTDIECSRRGATR